MINKQSRNINYNILDDDYIAGLIHADGGLSVPLIRPNKTIYPRPQVSITQHIDNKDIIMGIKQRFGNIGSIRFQEKDNQIKYKIDNINDINRVVIPFLTKHQLRSNKYLSFLKWKLYIDIVLNEKPIYGSSLWLDLLLITTRINPLVKISKQLRYLKQDESDKITNYEFNNLDNIIDLTRKYSNELYEISFWNDIYNHEPLNQSLNNPINKEFINGLFDGDGSLSVQFKSPKNKSSMTWSGVFQIVQDKYNESVLLELISYFKCGKITHRSDEFSCSYFAYKTDIFKNIIPQLTNWDCNESLDWNNMIGPNVKLYKFYNFIIIFLEGNSKGDLKHLNKLINYAYNIIKNPKNLTLEEYRDYILERLRQE